MAIPASLAFNPVKPQRLRQPACAVLCRHCRQDTQSTFVHPWPHDEPNLIKLKVQTKDTHSIKSHVSRRQSCHLSTPSHPRVPPVWPYCRWAQCGCWFTVQWSIADLLTSSILKYQPPLCLDYRSVQTDPARNKVIDSHLSSNSLFQFFITK